jgi:ubiquinone biosynthesis protein UbiJ
MQLKSSIANALTNAEWMNFPHENVRWNLMELNVLEKVVDRVLQRNILLYECLQTIRRRQKWRKLKC